MKTVIIFLVLFAFIGCNERQEYKEKMFTESQTLDYISRTFEYAYIQGSQDALGKVTLRIDSGSGEELTTSYFYNLMDKRRETFLKGDVK